LAVQWLNEVHFSNQAFVVADNLALRNRQLLVEQTVKWQESGNAQPRDEKLY
jgi:hypothetical protein